MEKNSVVDEINRRLKIYGSNIYDDPLFRVVFSDDQLETRLFDRFGIKGTQEAKKYPWIQRKWIIERWASGELAYHPNLITIKDGLYICVYVFQDKYQNYLPPLWKVCEIIIKNLLHPRKRSETLAEDEIILNKEKELEIDKIQLEMQNESDRMATKDKHSSRESISVGYTEEKIKGE